MTRGDQSPVWHASSGLNEPSECGVTEFLGPNSNFWDRYWTSNVTSSCRNAVLQSLMPRKRFS